VSTTVLCIDILCIEIVLDLYNIPILMLTCTHSDIHMLMMQALIPIMACVCAGTHSDVRRGGKRGANGRHRTAPLGGHIATNRNDPRLRCPIGFCDSRGAQYAPALRMWI
jgi:hypothetical protein